MFVIIPIKYVKPVLTRGAHGSWLWRPPVCGGLWENAHFALP